jgi:hypothetical protein
MAKRGRKLIPIDWQEFDKLMFLGASLRESSWWFGCSEDTIERAIEREKGMNFAEYQAQKEVLCKIGLKRKIIEKALAGDNTMLIWASKNYLNWSDKVEGRHDIRSQGDIKLGIDLVANPGLYDALERVADAVTSQGQAPRHPAKPSC